MDYSVESSPTYSPTQVTSPQSQGEDDFKKSNHEFRHKEATGGMFKSTSFIHSKIKLDLSKKKPIMTTVNFEDDEVDDDHSNESRSPSPIPRAKEEVRHSPKVQTQSRLPPPSAPAPTPAPVFKEKPIIHTPSTVTGMDSFGFFIGKPVARLPESTSSSQSRTSRRDRNLVVDFGFTSMPKQWTDIKEQNLCLCQSHLDLEQFKDDLEKAFPNQRIEPASQRQKLMTHIDPCFPYPSSAEREYIVSVLKFKKKEYRERDHLIDKVEFPREDLQQTKTKDHEGHYIKWSLNPKFCFSVLKTREQVKASNTKARNLFLEQIINAHPPEEDVNDSAPQFEAQWYLHKDQFLAVNPTKTVFQNQIDYWQNGPPPEQVEEDMEQTVEDGSKKRKKTHEDSESEGKGSKEKMKKKKKKKHKKKMREEEANNPDSELSSPEKKKKKKKKKSRHSSGEENEPSKEFDISKASELLAKIEDKIYAGKSAKKQSFDHDKIKQVQKLLEEDEPDPILASLINLGEDAKTKRARRDRQSETPDMSPSPIRQSESETSRTGPRTPSPSAGDRPSQALSTAGKGPRTPSPRARTPLEDPTDDFIHRDPDPSWTSPDGDRYRRSREFSPGRYHDRRPRTPSPHRREFRSPRRERSPWRDRSPPSPGWRRRRTPPPRDYRERRFSPIDYGSSRRYPYYRSPPSPRSRYSPPDRRRYSRDSRSPAHIRHDSYYHSRDNEISDLDLLISHRAIPSDSMEILAASASPKRVTLDERLEKEHGIKISEEQQLGLHPNLSVPPPGYTVTGERVASIPPPMYHHPIRAPPPFPMRPAPVQPVASGDDQKHVRVGNMLQIVPQDPSTSPVVKKAKEEAKASSSSAVAMDLQKTMEEMTKQESKIELERRLRREKRIAEQLQEVEQLKKEEPETDIESKEAVTGERILETIEKQEMDHDVAELKQEDHKQDEVNPQEMSLNDLKKGKANKMRYISLKPLSKKERRRQEMAAKAAAEAVQDANEDEEEFKPRSPVALPDVSTCKPILLRLEPSRSNRVKKGVLFVDNVVPGEGTPDNSDAVESDSAEVQAPPVEKTSTNDVVVRPKRRKRIIVKIVRTRYAGDSSTSEDEAEAPPPPPPPGSPNLYHTAEYIQKFGYHKAMVQAQ